MKKDSVKKTSFRRPEYKVRYNITLKNIFNNTDFVGDIINEEEIEGKGFYVLKVNNRVYKLAKDAHTLLKVQK